MNRKVGFWTGVALTGLACYLGAQVSAQQPVPHPGVAPPAAPVAHPQPAAATAPTAVAPLRTRIALVNMMSVLKGYRKAQSFQDQLTQQTRDIDKNYLEPLRTQLNKLRGEFQTCTDQARRDQIERDSRKLQLDLQEKEEDARKRISKQQGDWTVQLYKEIEDTVRAFAKANDIELVLFYTDPTNPADPYNPATVQRKLLMGAAMPLYAAPGMDISDAIVGHLNARFPATAAPTSAAPAPNTGVTPVSHPAPAPRQ